MRGVTLVAGAAILLSIFFQCRPRGPAQTQATTVPTEQLASPTTPSSPTPEPPVPSPTAGSPRVQALVVRVIDGDTIEVDIEGAVCTVRYLGINCPEADCEAGRIATDMNRAMVEGKVVDLEKDVSETDEYGRLLRYVYVGGVLVNARLIGWGYAYAATIPPDVSRTEQFLDLEQEARVHERGVWGMEPLGRPVLPSPTPTFAPPSPTAQPATGTPAPATSTPIAAAPANLVVSPGCCQFNSPGDDNYSKEEEYVCLTNAGGQAADMTGWYLRDEYGWGYTFPQFSLAPEATVRVRTGCGTNGTADLYWCKDGTAVWNNGGDTVFLYDANGSLVVQYSY